MEEQQFEHLVSYEVARAEYPYEYATYSNERRQLDVAQVSIREDGDKYGMEAAVNRDDSDKLIEYHIKYLLAEFDRRMLTGSAEVVEEGSEFPRY